MEINSQRHIRTGDVVLSKKDHQNKIVHFVVDLTGAETFEQPVSKIKSLIVYNGSLIETLSIKEVKLT